MSARVTIVTIVVLAGCSGSAPEVATPPEVAASADTTESEDAAAPDVAAPECAPGAAGCACLPTTGCDAGLHCAVGVCQAVAMACAPGRTGCPCKAGNLCDRSADDCADGLCMPSGCKAGELHCSCVAGACADGLACQDELICAANTGNLGGFCFADGTCNPGNRCQAGLCVPCQAGSLGCACSSGACGSGGVCESGVCVSASDPTAVPPSNPKCYTPCSSGLTGADGAYYPCKANGLMEGCFGGLECVGGSCVTPGGDPAACQKDTGCPEFQRCILGTCYATCDEQTPCGDGETCHQQACRKTCQTAAPSCGPSMTCQSDNGGLGVCLPLAEHTGTLTQTVTLGVITVSTHSLALTNVKPSATFTVTNGSVKTETVTIRKLRHVRSLAGGTVEEITGVAGCAGAACPLSWLGLGKPGAATPVTSLQLTLAPNETATVEVGLANESGAARWTGELALDHPTLNQEKVNLEFVERPEGVWRGAVYYLANFGTANLASWALLPNPKGGAPPPWNGTKDEEKSLNKVGNALVQRWGAFRGDRIKWDEFRAVLKATETESWAWPSVESCCPATSGACYLFAGSAKTCQLEQYTDVRSDVPTGVTEMPIALNIHLPDSQDLTRLEGAIDSDRALQYPGRPKVSIELEDPVTGCSRESTVCITFLKSFSADIFVGGRYTSNAADTACARRKPAAGATANGYALGSTPWLVPGFQRATEVDPATGQPARFECVDEALPLSNGDTPVAAGNANLATGNPVPDGRARRRELRLIDGALIDQTTMFILFEERFDSFFGNDDDGFSAYGYMVLEREPTSPVGADADGDGTDDLYEASVTTDARPEPTDVLGVQCSKDVLDRVLPPGATLSATNAGEVMRALIDGTVVADAPIDPAKEHAHYYCEDTGAFDAGPNGTTECPVGSRVDFFTLDPAVMSDEALMGQPCQYEHTCGEVLGGWTLSDGSPIAPLVRLAPAWVCSADLKNPTTAAPYCDLNRLDLREGKTFFAAEHKLTPLRHEVDYGFRYKVKFQNREGTSIGFVPQICPGGPDLAPYCYDPEAIEGSRARIDCLLAIWRDWRKTLAPGDASALKSLLTDTFSTVQTGSKDTPLPAVADGFERLYAELLTMLGDDAYTRALASRFDLAQSKVLSFDGSRFEPNGTDLSGLAGYEMYNLYQSVQYYQEALDRFYALSPTLWAAVGAPGDSFVTSKTVLTYFDRLTQAATHKMRAINEIAQRYVSLNRPDLARRVIERAYGGAYLESIVLSRMMLHVVSVTVKEERDAIRKALDSTQRRYRESLLAMRSIHDSLNEELNLFGYSPDFIPFPTIEGLEQNAFEQILPRAKARLNIAKERESEALASDRAFDTDSAEFQSQLVTIRNNYENQLADICGTFDGGAGVLYPAIEKYAYLSAYTRTLGDPCGLVGTGEVHLALGEVQIALTEIQRINKEIDNTGHEIELERGRLEQYCGAIAKTASFVYTQAQQKIFLQEQIQQLNVYKDWANTASQVGQALGQGIMSCQGYDGCAAGLAGAAVSIASISGAAYFNSLAQKDINTLEVGLSEIDANTAHWEMSAQCDYAEIDSDHKTATHALRIAELQIDILKAQLTLRQHLSEIQRLLSKGKRLQVQQREAEQLAINVEAAHNDPNIRIYRNDAVLNADIAFEDALREAYRTTLVFEYYTSQTYAKRGQLFLIRMAAKGEPNLENYLTQIENAFFEFEDVHGLPDKRVAVVSLKDDILQVPRLDDEGKPLSVAERTARLRDALANPARLDENGYLVLTFRTDLEALSPLTRIHKVRYVEAEINTAGSGDIVGRLYLSQKGTCTIRGLEGAPQLYRFPPRTAVLNPFFNGVRYFSPEVYQSVRLKDRPIACSDWALTINQKDEFVNQDLDLQSLTDIRLFIHYTDFSEL